MRKWTHILSLSPQREKKNTSPLANATKAYHNLQLFLIQNYSQQAYGFDAYSQYSIAQTQY